MAENKLADLSTREPILQNEPIRIFVSYSPITHKNTVRTKISHGVFIAYL